MYVVSARNMELVDFPNFPSAILDPPCGIFKIQGQIRNQRPQKPIKPSTRLLRTLEYLTYLLRR